MTTPPPDPISHASLTQLVVRAADCLRAVLHAPTNQAGLNETRYNVLELLSREPAGSCSQSFIASRLLQSESNLSTLLDRMHGDGLIARTRSSTDRRRVAISLTPAGCEALAQADGHRARAAAEALQALGESERTALGNWLQLLIRRLERALGAESADSGLRLASPSVAGAESGECLGAGQRDANAAADFGAGRPAA